MTSPTDALRERVSDKWSPHVRTTITRALTAVDLSYEARKPNPRPPESQRERDADKAALLAHLAKYVGPLVRKSEIELAKHKEQLLADRFDFREKAMQHDTPRDAQIAAEMRAHLKSLDPGARLKMLYGPTANKLAQRSALETHPALIGGMEADVLHKIEGDFMQKNFPNAVAGFAEREAAIEHSDASVRMAKNTLVATADLPPDKYTEFYETLKPA